MMTTSVEIDRTDKFEPYSQFFLFGDSITQNSYDQERGFGFSAALQADTGIAILKWPFESMIADAAPAYIRRLDVINRGLSGYNSRQALKVLPAVVPSPEQANIRFFTVFFGANDASLPEAPNKQHISITEYKDNLEKIITHPKVVAHNARIILIAPPPVNEHLWWPRDQSSGYTSISRIASTTKEYAEAACEVGTRLGVEVVNLWKVFMEKTDYASKAWRVGDALPGSLSLPQNDALVELMYDGLHFNPAGYDILFQEVMKLIARQWPDQLPDNLPMQFPLFKDEDAWREWENTHAHLK